MSKHLLDVEKMEIDVGETSKDSKACWSKPCSRCCPSCCTPRCCCVALASFVVLVVAFFCGPRLGPSKHGERWLSPDRPLVISHGDCPCLPEPANSLAWFKWAAAVGVDVLEMDLQLTSDDILITFHDETWDHLSNYTGRVRETPYATVASVVDISENYDEHAFLAPPTLDDVLSAFAYSHLRFNMEIKTAVEDSEVVAEKLCSLLESHGVSRRTLVASFHSEPLVHVRNKCGNNVATSSSESETRNALVPILLDLDRWWWHPGDISVMQLPTEGGGFDLTEKVVIERLHQHGVAYYSWVINDRETMDKLINNGVDGIISDDIVSLRTALEEAGLSLPPEFEVDE